MRRTLGYGAWPSPISPSALAESSRPLSDVSVVGNEIWWVEGRPVEGGRNALMKAGLDGDVSEVSPDDWSVRTTVHEYGGAPWVSTSMGPVVSRYDDQRLWLLIDSGDPIPVTPVPGIERGLRYADAVPHPNGKWLFAVRETHRDDGEPVNDLVRVNLDGSGVESVVSGADFYAAPRISPDGAELTWVTWNHPSMPWDSTTLQVAELDDQGNALKARTVAGGADVSVEQPKWGDDGSLYWVSDHTGWWNLVKDGFELYPDEHDWGHPAWVFGLSTYAIRRDGSVVAGWMEEGISRLGVIDSGELREVATSFTYINDVSLYDDQHIAARVAAPAMAAAVVLIDVESGAATTIRSSADRDPDPGLASVPEPISFPSEGGRTAHSIFYSPANPDFVGPDEDLPPLVVMSHGGPTSMAAPVWSPGVAFWTSRGFGVVEVNYGGSTGYGREYRSLLNGRWGIVDLDDCIAAARFLASAGRVDGDRLIIRGGSAGGYTTLCALTFRDDFACGASYFGVGDLGALATDTHKFESRYLDSMVGPWPEARPVYEERSPVFHTEKLHTPMILFQGADDRVVPPAQAEAMVRALVERGVKHEYHVYEGEGHGFRQADNIAHAAEAEYRFYCEVLGIPK